MAGSTGALDVMAMYAERRQTRPMAISIALGNNSYLNDDHLRVTSIQGQEGVSQPYSFTVELRANEYNPADSAELDEYGEFVGTDLLQGSGTYLLGKWVQLRVAMPYDEDRFTHTPEEANPDWEDSTPSRFFCGIISAISHSAPGEYSLTVQSPLYPATLRNRYDIYKDMFIEDVITKVLEPEVFNYNPKVILQFNLEGATCTRRQDWLQAGESDFAFLQRIMAKATIHFYFIHAADSLTVVFSNKTTSPQEVSIPGATQVPLPLRYSYTDIHGLGNQQSDLFTQLRYEVKMVQNNVQTVLVRQPPVWTENPVISYTPFGDPTVGSDPNAEYMRYRTYSYGVDSNEASGQELKMQQQLATDQGTLSGTATSPLLSPGYTFELQQEVVPDTVSASRMPAQFSGRVFVVTKVTHKVADNQAYSADIEATEVTDTGDSTQDTLITPFDMQGTQQGSITAKVLKTAVPKDWRYRDKNNFQTELSMFQFDSSQEKEIGCIVEFATDGSQHWVALSASSQTAPEVHSMVSIGRAGNESEVPEIQQVLSSHGQKTIQPAERRNNHWTANTSWGSNYSTSFGDSISIRYGSESSVDLAQAIKIVEDGYDFTGVLSTNYGSSSFNKGSSFSFSVSDDDAAGLSNASVSAGCSFSESFSDQNYSVSYTDVQQSRSKTNKSVNRSYQGTFTDKISYDSPSFIKGELPDTSIIDITDQIPDGSSYNESYTTGKQISFNYIGEAPPDPCVWDDTCTVYSESTTVGNVGNKSTQTGDTYSESTTTGDAVHTSTTTGNVTSTNTMTGDTTSTSTTVGNNTSTNTMTGDTNNTSTTTGNAVNNSTTTGNTTSTQVYDGDQTSTSTTTGNTTNTSTTTGDTTTNSTTTGNANHTSKTTGNTTSNTTTNGDTTSTSTTTGNVTSTNTTNGDTDNTSTTNGNTTTSNTVTGDNTSTSTTTGNSTSTSTTIGLTNQTDTFIGARNTTSMNLAATQTTNLFLGATNDTALKLAAAASQSISMSANMNLSMAMSADLNLSMSMSASLSLSTFMGISVSNDFNGGIKAQIAAGSPVIQTMANLKAALKGAPEAKIVTLDVEM